MNKKMAQSLIEQRIPKELLLDELIKAKKQKSIWGKFKSGFVLFSKVFFAGSLISILISCFFSDDKAINFMGQILLILILMFSSILLVVLMLEYLKERYSDPDKYYKDQKFQRQLRKHYEINDKLNEKLDFTLSFNTYQLMTEYFSESELKEIALLKLTYRDLNLEDYYFTSGKEAVLTRSHIERIDLANKLRDAKLILIEKIKEEEKKEKKIEASDMFVSSLYKK